MKCSGTVEKVKGRHASVRVDHGRCGQCTGCVAMTNRDPNEDIDFEVENILDAKPGDRVVMEMPSGKVYKAYVKVFWLPVIALVAGYALGALAIAPLFDISTQATGAVLAIAAGAFFFWVGVRLTRQSNLKPVMLRLAGDDDDA